MRLIHRPVIVLLALLVFAGSSLFAASEILDIHSVPRKLGQETTKASDGGAERTREKWGYDLTLENKTFQPLNSLEVRYIIFYKSEKLGHKAGPALERQTGILQIPVLVSHQKKTITTEPVELKRSHLVGNWIYRSGAKPNANDILVGIWVRVFQDDQQIGEYANPSSLKTNKWD